jgi:cystathionine beta-lyase/cystathionine gamma-synthase
MCRRDTQIRVSWSLGINFVGSTYGGQAAIFDELRARVVIWPPPSTNPNLRIIDIAAVSRIAHLVVP